VTCWRSAASFAGPVIAFRTVTKPPVKAGIYVRISRDREGDSASPQRQEEACRKVCETKGWEVRGVYSDRDLSAYKAGVVRPEFDQLLADVRAGLVGAVVVWKIDRVARSVMTLMKMVETLTDNGTEFVSVAESIDTSTPNGRFFLQQLGSLAELESATISYRVKSANDHLARKGAAHKGGRRTFGWEPDRITPRESEAVLLRDAAERVIAGESLRSIARRWNDLGVRTPGSKAKPEGSQWSGSQMHEVLSHARHGGYRSHHGALTRGEWPPIFGEDLYYKLHDVIDDGNRVIRAQTRVHLLSGLMRCGLCSAPMRYKTGSNQADRYCCIRNPGSNGCGRVTIAKPGSDELVRAMVLQRVGMVGLYREGAIGVQARRRQLEDGLEHDREALRDLSRARFVDRIITEDEYLASREPLAHRAEQWERELAHLAPEATHTIPTDLQGVTRWWDSPETTTPMRRELIGLVIAKLTCFPQRPGAPRPHATGSRYSASSRIIRNISSAVTVARAGSSTPRRYLRQRPQL
jgi:site-specific DNA recombinase